MGHESFDLLLLGKLVTFFPSVFSFLFVPRRRRLRSSFFYCLKFFSVNWVLLLTAHLFLFEEREKIPFIFQFSLLLYRFRIVLRKDSVRERAKRIRSNEVQELFMMLSSVETWPMCLIFWGFCTSGRMCMMMGEKKGGIFPTFNTSFGKLVNLL